MELFWITHKLFLCSHKYYWDKSTPIHFLPGPWTVWSLPLNELYRQHFRLLSQMNCSHHKPLSVMQYSKTPKVHRSLFVELTCFIRFIHSYRRLMRVYIIHANVSSIEHNVTVTHINACCYVIFLNDLIELQIFPLQ